MFLGCSLVVSSFLLLLFVPCCPPSRHPRHPKTRSLQPCLPPSTRAPIRSSRPASRQPTIATPNLETAAALSRLQWPPPAAQIRIPKEGSIPKIEATLGHFGLRVCASALTDWWYCGRYAHWRAARLRDRAGAKPNRPRPVVENRSGPRANPFGAGLVCPDHPRRSGRRNTARIRRPLRGDTSAGCRSGPRGQSESA